jgi:hypothetical protein
LAQLLDKNPHLLSFFHERASISNEATLGSATIAKEMIETALKSCEKTYLVIDGVDECVLPARGYDDRNEIASSFQEIIKNLPVTEEVSIRCLFVSQDDDTFQGYFGHLPTIRIADENQGDLKSFSFVWQQRIEEKFGELRSKNYNISNIISARAQGKLMIWLDDDPIHQSYSNSSRNVHLRRAFRKVSRGPNKPGGPYRGTTTTKVACKPGSCVSFFVVGQRA